jgi:hypothetical protein
VQHPKEQRNGPIWRTGAAICSCWQFSVIFHTKRPSNNGAFFLMVSSYAQMRKYSLLRIWSTQPTVQPLHTQISLRKTRGVVPYNEYTAQLLFCPSWWCITRVTINRGTIHFMSSTVCIRCCVKNG